MPRFAANLSMMFPGLEAPRRFQAARDAGFEAGEYLRPHADPVETARQWIDDAGVEMILLNSPIAARVTRATARQACLMIFPGIVRRMRIRPVRISSCQNFIRNRTSFLVRSLNSDGT